MERRHMRSVNAANIGHIVKLKVCCGRLDCMRVFPPPHLPLNLPLTLVILCTCTHMRRTLATDYTYTHPLVLNCCAHMRTQGTITTVSDVKPLVTVAAYTDVETGHELYQEVRIFYGAMHVLLASVHACVRACVRV